MVGFASFHSISNENGCNLCSLISAAFGMAKDWVWTFGLHGCWVRDEIGDEEVEGGGRGERLSFVLIEI